MIRRSPAETYIRYLILHPRKYANAQIKDILLYSQLDYVGDWYVDKLREQLSPPTPFRPFDKTHRPSKRYLLSTGLTWIFHPDAEGKRAFQILELPRIKEFVEAMLTSNAPFEPIAAELTQRRNFACTPLAVQRYREFFWNMDLVDSTELRALLQFRVDQLAAHSDPQVQAQQSAVKKAFWNDARRTASELPFSPLSALIAQMRMGLMPSKLDLARVLEQGRNFAAIRILEAAANNGRGDSSKAFDYATVLEKITNTLERIVTPDAELYAELAKITLRTDDVPIPTIHQLSGGRHTADLSPTNEAEHGFGDEGVDESADEGSIVFTER